MNAINIGGLSSSEQPVDKSEATTRIFVGGDRSQVGKSSVCLGILGSLLRRGYSPTELAYIKPVTQCEQPQAVHTWCDARGIACRRVGAVVFYAGFTRAFLRGEVGTSKKLLDDIASAVDEISVGKRIVLIDGVGYPSVGSICGISNAQVASFLNACVLLVGRSGVGDAVDSYNLNATYFRANNVPILGIVFNKLPSRGFYSLKNCKVAVNQYFENRKEKLPFGFVPDVKPLLEKDFEEISVRIKEDVNDAARAHENEMVLVACHQSKGDLEPFKPFLSMIQYCEGLFLVLIANMSQWEDVLDELIDDATPCFFLFQNGLEIVSYRGNSILDLTSAMKQALNNSEAENSIEAAYTMSHELTFPSASMDSVKGSLSASEVFVSVFSRHIEVDRILNELDEISTEGSHTKSNEVNEVEELEPSNDRNIQVKSREQIEAEAALQGGSGSCALKRDFARYK